MAKIVTLSEAASIALHGMVLIARDENNTNVLHIAEATHSSKHHVAKIMQRLVKDDFLESSRGPKGGFKLKRNPEEISFLDVFESIEGKIVDSSCPLDKQVCGFDKCIMNNITKKMTIQFREYMKSQTLEDYLKL
ncbi:MAG: hypothetical protein RIS47_1518 [Bacteroidota bacterium]|jgi:Rrf2 family protein